jgi:hypothetical protein
MPEFSFGGLTDTATTLAAIRRAFGRLKHSTYSPKEIPQVSIGSPLVNEF